jgi:hypothetical protein
VRRRHNHRNRGRRNDQPQDVARDKLLRNATSCCSPHRKRRNPGIRERGRAEERRVDLLIIAVIVIAWRVISGRRPV